MLKNIKRIMITNDDGVKADGIIRLAKAVKSYGEVWVVAPDVQKSGASHSINLHTPISVSEVEFPVEGVKAFAVSGSPADCVRIGVLNLLPKKPDLVFSGINFGYNAGTDVMYSGTIGAAMEAVFQGIPSIALSEGTNEGYIITDLWLDIILSEIMGMRHGTDNILNINFPTCKPEELKGILRNRFVSKSCIYKDTYICNTLPDGTKTYMINGEYQENAEDGSDLKALFDKYISIGTVNNIG
ncbi:MAG: 5'/3'-nucleotidase SurE [Oscillospiraceae bacterium]|nr:5'/3'-nucleotidase SurE [Oscillospiraceae bacterium]